MKARSKGRSLLKRIGVTQRPKAEALRIAELVIGTLRRVINRITFLAALFALSGTYVMWKGYQFGELLIGGALTLGGQLPALVTSFAQMRRGNVTIEQPDDKPVPIKQARKFGLTKPRKRR